MIYLDHAATSVLRPQVRDAMLRALDVVGNPSSIHQAGQQARFLVDTARRQVADFCGVRPEQVVFTGSGSEANNLALRGVMAIHPNKRLVTCAIEHSCVLETAKALREQGTQVTILPPNERGFADPLILEEELKKGDVALVSFMSVNNETGITGYTEAYRRLCAEHGALYHTDAVQAAGHLKLSGAGEWWDMLTLSAHKLGGPQGIGALILPGKIDMQAQITGGAQERNRRAGTENVVAIVGFGVACEQALQDLRTENNLGELLRTELQAAGLPTKIVGENEDRAGHIHQLITTGLRSEDALVALDLAGICVSQGSACSSGRSEPSHVLLAMGYSPEEASCGLRVSTGWNTTEADIKTFVTTFADVYKRLVK